MVPIFISYRRQDSAAFSGRLYDRLSDCFGAENVFIDVAEIAAGQDFVKAIENKITAAQVMLVIIGDEWLELLRSGQQKTAADFVQLEIQAALRHNLRLIPVLTGGARMPEEGALPVELAALARRHAVEIRDSHFHQDVTALIADLTGQQNAEPLPRKARRTSRWRLMLGALLLICLALGAYWWQSEGLDPGRLAGIWTAEVTNRQGASYRLVFQFESFNQQLTGQVRYPTGTAAIVDSRISGPRIEFTTEHIPQFETQPAKIHFKGQVRNERIEFFMQHDLGQERFTAVKGSD